jgi:hypothetical protein
VDPEQKEGETGMEPLLLPGDSHEPVQLLGSVGAETASEEPIDDSWPPESPPWPRPEASGGIASPEGGHGEKPGIDPLELLGLPADQREIINWLLRNRRATFAELLAALDKVVVDIPQQLDRLVADGHVEVIAFGGEDTYQVKFRGSSARRLRDFPKDIWKRAGLDEDG